MIIFSRSPVSLGRKCSQISLFLLLCLGLGGSFPLVLDAIAPPVARAYTATTTIELYRRPGESFKTLLRRAETVARAAAQRSFDRDILITAVTVDVVGKNNGAIAPVFRLQVSRQGWQQRPDAREWGIYLPNAPFLLGFTGDEGEE